MHFALIDFGIKAKQEFTSDEYIADFALIDFGIKAKLSSVYVRQWSEYN